MAGGRLSSQGTRRVRRVERRGGDAGGRSADGERGWGGRGRGGVAAYAARASHKNIFRPAPVFEVKQPTPSSIVSLRLPDSRGHRWRRPLGRQWYLP